MRRPWVRWTIGAVAVVVLWLVTPYLLRRVSWFAVRRIELVGGRYLSAKDVARTLALPRTANIFDRQDGWAARVRAMPGVREAEVDTRMPGTVVVTIREATPVAVAPVGGRLGLIDGRGRVLPFDPTRAAEDLPVAIIDSAVAGVLARIRESDQSLYGQIERAGRDRGTIILDLPPRRVLLRVGASVDDIRRLGVVLNELERRGALSREVDARFEGRVIVRGRTA